MTAAAMVGAVVHAIVEVALLLPFSPFFPLFVRFFMFFFYSLLNICTLDSANILSYVICKVL